MKTLVRQWYIDAFKDDDLGLELRDEITFVDVFECLQKNEDIYVLIDVSDSIIRERIFTKLAELLKEPYEYVYDLWLNETQITKCNLCDEPTVNKYCENEYCEVYIRDEKDTTTITYDDTRNIAIRSIKKLIQLGYLPDEEDHYFNIQDAIQDEINKVLKLDMELNFEIKIL